MMHYPSGSGYFMIEDLSTGYKFLVKARTKRLAFRRIISLTGTFPDSFVIERLTKKEYEEGVAKIIADRSRMAKFGCYW